MILINHYLGSNLLMGFVSLVGKGDISTSGLNLFKSYVNISVAVIVATYPRAVSNTVISNESLA